MRLTLYGMYQYDKTLFDGIILPDQMDRDTLIDEIIQKSGDLYPYYQVPPILKRLIGRFFGRRKYDFEMMYKALNTEYNPIENYDRKEDSHRLLKDSGKDTSTTTLGSTQTYHAEQTLDTETTNEVSAADSSGYQSDTHQTINGTPEQTSTTTGSGSDVVGTEYGKQNDDTFESRIHGNIGITTNSQMITQELQMRKVSDLYSLIAEIFEKEFIVQVY